MNYAPLGSAWVKAVKIHAKNLQTLVNEMLKVKNEIVPKIIKDLFKHSSSNYDLRNDRGFVSNFVKTVFWYWVTFLYGFKIMNSFTSELENITDTNVDHIINEKIGAAKLPLLNL